MSAVWKRMEKQWVEVYILQPISCEVKVLHNRGVVNQDVGRAAQIKAEARHDFFRDYRAAHDMAALYHCHTITSLG
jgi:hypothetical protein